MQYVSNEQNEYFKRSMTELWNTMSRLYHPAWANTNGEIGSKTFQDWTRELLPYGSRGVLRGIDAVRAKGSRFTPNLNEFLSLCREGRSEMPSGTAPNPGEWHTCPYTGRRRRLRDVTITNPLTDDTGRFVDDPRSDDQIRQDIEAMLAAGATYSTLIDGVATPQVDENR